MRKTQHGVVDLLFCTWFVLKHIKNNTKTNRLTLKTIFSPQGGGLKKILQLTLLAYYNVHHTQTATLNRINLLKIV